MKRIFVSAALAALLGVAAAGCHDPQNSPSNSPVSAPPAETQSPPAITAPPAPPGKIVVYVINPKATGDQDMLMPREITLHHPQEPARDAVNALLDSEHSPLVAGTSLRGLTIDSGVATVDFSQSPINETGGESAQSAALNALGMTLGQFPEINSYQIEVKGQPIKSFGEFTTDGPMDVIRPGGERQAEEGGQ